MSNNILKERSNTIITTKEGYEAICIDYINKSHIIIEFNDKYKAIVSNTWYNFINGNIHNPYHPTFLNVGIIGNINVKENHLAYVVWRDMLRRCYDLKIQIKQPTYKNCNVCDEWLIFENFVKWFDKNYYTVENETMNLDKDIINKGNKTYSPQNCIFVPQSINKLILTSKATRGELPIGIRYIGDKYQARCSIKNKTKVIGCFKNIEDAFIAYKNTKETHIKTIAEEYKNKIPYKLYNALCQYTIDIND